MTHVGRGRGVLLVVALVATLVGPAMVARADVTAQACSARAVVVVEPGPGPVTICFHGSISGLDALQLAGANPTTYGFAGQGGAVCKLYGVGNPADSSCLLGPGGQYWAYYRAGPGAGGWTYSRGGASAATVTDGSVEGWRYGTGGAPGFVSFCSVAGCAPPPTDPPPATQAAPPVLAAPAPGPSTPAPPEGVPTTPTTAAGKDSGKDSGKAKGAGGAASDSGAATNADGAKDGSSTTTGKSGTRTGDRRDRSGSVEVAAGGTGGGSDGGSPVGVLVAAAVVAAAVAGGLLIRRRRGGPAPG